MMFLFISATTKVGLRDFLCREDVPQYCTSWIGDRPILPEERGCIMIIAINDRKLWDLALSG
jgi:hypothetical protein